MWVCESLSSVLWPLSLSLRVVCLEKNQYLKKSENNREPKRITHTVVNQNQNRSNASVSYILVVGLVRFEILFTCWTHSCHVKFCFFSDSFFFLFVLLLSSLHNVCFSKAMSSYKMWFPLVSKRTQSFRCELRGLPHSSRVSLHQKKNNKNSLFT